MNSKSLRLIEDVVINSGKWVSLEMAQDSIYLHFIDVELGKPHGDDTFSLITRFGENSFISVFYNDIRDIDFLSHYNFKHQILSEDFTYKIKSIKFIDFEFLNVFFTKYEKHKEITNINDFNIHNIRNDFFLMFETENLAIVVGGDKMDFFFEYERLDDDNLKELSNKWMLYFLNYHLKRNIIKDPMCENHPLMYRHE